MRKDAVKLSNVKVGALTYGGTFDNHMKFGDKSGHSHTGLHILSEFTKNTGHALTSGDITSGNTVAGTLNGRATTLTIVDVDTRAKTFKADVNIYGVPKRSTFFPIGTTLDTAKGYILAAWNDHCTYGTSEYGGGKVDIYKQMRDRFGLNWVGLATIGGYRIWVGSALSGSLVTAFPAVNNKFN